MRQLILALSSKNLAQQLKSLFERYGLPVAGTCASGAQALQLVASCPDGGVLICPLQLTDMPVQQLLNLLPDSFDCLLLLKTGQQDLVSGPGIYKLTEPINGVVLLDWTRQLLTSRQIQAVRGPNRHYEAAQPVKPPLHGRNTEDQKIIEQAKYLLINRRKISEQEAHRYLQRKSMQTGIRLVDLAYRLIHGHLPSEQEPSQ